MKPLSIVDTKFYTGTQINFFFFFFQESTNDMMHWTGGRVDVSRWNPTCVWLQRKSRDQEIGKSVFRCFSYLPKMENNSTISHVNKGWSWDPGIYVHRRQKTRGEMRRTVPTWCWGCPTTFCTGHLAALRGAAACQWGWTPNAKLCLSATSQPVLGKNRT